MTMPIVGAHYFRPVGIRLHVVQPNSLTFPADVVPKNSTASVWALPSVAAGLGGRSFNLFQENRKSISESVGYATAYNYIFIGMDW